MAAEWITRPRQFGWPSASVIQEIIQDGVLLVAACHPTSDDPHNEWRVSFTMAERTLVDTLSDVQRLAYLYAKLVWMHSLKPKSWSFLVSYHLKNALLWLCEERPSEFWRGDNLVVCVRDIFRWLQKEISSGQLRHYFIAADNMIPSWVECTVDVIQSLGDITDNVFQVMFHLSTNHSCSGYSTVSRKNVPHLACYNLDIHGLIMKIFGTGATEKIGNQNVLYFFTSPYLCFCTTWEAENPKIASFHLNAACFLTRSDETH